MKTFVRFCFLPGLNLFDFVAITFLSGAAMVNPWWWLALPVALAISISVERRLA